MSLIGRLRTATAGLLTRAGSVGASKAVAPVDGSRGWWPVLREFTAGAWQANLEVTLEDSLSYWVQFRCISMIASDIAKMRLKLVRQDSDGVWVEIQRPSSRIFTKPNHYQTRIQFFESWMLSKLSRGNTYVLKRRNGAGQVDALYVLNPDLVRPMVSDNGDVFYELRQDYLSGLDGGGLLVPASEIIHDRWNTLYHPLVGLSPIYANGVVALAGKRMTTNSARFFANGARPSGILVAPGPIDDTKISQLKEYWNSNFTGENAGKLAVLGDGLKYEQMTMTAVDAQLIEQLKWGDATIAGSYGVPAYMVNAGTPPAYNNVQALSQQYYAQCLQIHIENIEVCLDDGLDHGPGLGVEFDLDDLLRMDTATQITAIKEAVAAGVMKPDEGRKKLGYGPVPGGDTPYLQQQNYSLAALAKRDAKEDPFGSSGGGNPANSLPANDNPEEERAFLAHLKKDVREALNAG